MPEEVKEVTRKQHSPLGRWGHSKDRLGEEVEDRDDLGSGKRTEGVSVPKGLGRKLPPLVGTEGAT
jgi:hypothetical protein